MTIPSEAEIKEALYSDCCDRSVSCDYDCAPKLRNYRDVLATAYRQASAKVEELEAALQGRTVSCVCGGEAKVKALKSREIKFREAVRNLERSAEKIVCACHEYRHSDKQLYTAIADHDALVKYLKTEKLPALSLTGRED